MTCVLITRAEPEASASAALVRTQGFAVVVMPLTQTKALPDGLEAVCALGDDPKGLVIVTSARAIDVLEVEGFGPWMARQRWAVVGERAATRLRALGASLVCRPAEDVGSLIARLSSISEPLTYLCAVDRKDALETHFPAMQAIPVYRAKALGEFTPDDIAALKADPPTHALLYSARGARLLADAVVAAGLEQEFSMIRWLCLSPDVAAHAPEDATILVAKVPTQQALLALLA